MDSEAVPQEARDAVFRSLKHEPENLICFQCGSKNPKWASVYMGLLICYNCTTLHRGLGTHISFVRSAELDKWTRRQLAFMECGGNRRAKEFFRRHGQGTAIDYSGAAAERYRVELEEKVSKLYPKRKEETVEVVPEVRSTEVKVPDLPKPVEQPKPMEQPKSVLPSAPSRSTVIHVAPVVPTAAPTFKFRKTKATVPPPLFKPVVFHPEEDEFQECNPPQDEHTVTPPIPAVQPQSVSPPPQQSFQPPVQSFQPPVQSFQPPVQSFQPAKQASKPAQKLQEKKAFSSEDFQEQVDAYTRKERMNRFSEAKAISSDAYFGRETEEATGSLGEEASRIAELASEKATVLKEKALDLYNALASRFSS